MQKFGHKEWRGHPYALNLRGEPRKLEPLLSNKNAPRHKRVHSIIQIVQGSLFFGLSLASSFDHSKLSFLGFFGLARNKS